MQSPHQSESDSSECLPESDLSLPDRNIHIFTTAALPWRTGTSINALLRALYILKEKLRQGDKGQVYLVLPWLDGTRSAAHRLKLYGTDVITLDGGPFSATWDTVVRVGGVDASVTDVVRTECDSCDTCRADADCLSCGACADCDAVCATCVQTAVFLVPDVTPGVQPVVLYNQHGTSEVASVEVLGTSTDTDTPADTDVAAPPSP